MSSIGTNASNIPTSQEIIPDSLNPNHNVDPTGVVKDEHSISSSTLKMGGGNRENSPSTSKGITRGSLMSLKSQDSIGTSSSICGDNVSITSSTRRTSGSYASASRRNNQHLGIGHHVAKSSSNVITGKTIGERGTKTSSISSAQSQGAVSEDRQGAKLPKDDGAAAESSRKDREARSIAIEKAYVHDVYEQISSHISIDSRYRGAWPRVKQFVQELEPGSVVCDVGCGNGKYLNINPDIFVVGSDRCMSLAQTAREKDLEVMYCDNLNLPLKDESLDAALSIAVIHHIATVERRVRALRELARVLRVGGKVMISVWAMEQKHRKFGSQDVLIPWHRQMQGIQSQSKLRSSINSRSSARLQSPQSKRGTAAKNHPAIERSITPIISKALFTFGSRSSSRKSKVKECGESSSHWSATSEDDVTHYHAYTQTTSDSAGPAAQKSTTGARTSGYRRRERANRIRNGRSFDPCAPEILDSQSYPAVLGADHHSSEMMFRGGNSSSDLSSPNETCYSFVRRAIERMSTPVPQRCDEPDDSEGASSSTMETRFPWLGLAKLQKFSVPANGSHEGSTTRGGSYKSLLSSSSRKKGNESGRSMFGRSVSTAMERGDSNESEESVGDMPIELRYLESDFFMDSFMVPDEMSENVPVYMVDTDNKNKYRAMTTAKNDEESISNGNDVKMPLKLSNNMNKSKSLDDLINAMMVEKIIKRKRKMGDAGFRTGVASRAPKLSETGRSNTYEDQTVSSKDDDIDYTTVQGQQYYNQQLFLLLRHRYRHFSASSQHSSRPASTSIGSSKITRTPGSTFDYDDLMGDEQSTNSRPHGGDNDEQEEGSSGKGGGSGSRSSGSIIKGLKTFSASMKSIDISLRSTSISSISSGKSLFSNFSAKSDSGIGLPVGSAKHQSCERSRHKSTSPSSSVNKYTSENVANAVRSEPKNKQSTRIKDIVGTTLQPQNEVKRRTWESEPHLDKIDVGQQKMSNLLKLKRGGSADESTSGSVDITTNAYKKPPLSTLQSSEQTSSTASSSLSTIRLIPQQYLLGEKEKLKVMQSMETKLMKAIKEVNECELNSNDSSPINSPSTSITVSTTKLSNESHTATSSTLKDCKNNDSIKLVSTSVNCCESTKQEPASSVVDIVLKSKRRPLLVKQKPSFRYPDEDDSTENLHDKAHQDIQRPTQNIEDEFQDESTNASNNNSRLREDDMHTTDVMQVEVLDENRDCLDKQNASAIGIDKVKDRPPSCNPFVTRISFEDLKEEVKLMPTFPPPDFVRTGSDDSGTGCSGTRPGSRAQTSLSIEEASDEYGDLPTIVSSVSRKGWKDGKQSSFNEDLISRDRFASNVEMRKRLMKQQSLPDDATGPGHAPETQKTLREKMMLAISKTKKFESLRNSLTMWRSGEQLDPEQENENEGEKSYENEENEIDSTEKRIDNGQQKEKIEHIKDAERSETIFRQTATKRQQSADAPQGSSFRSGIVRIFQSWRSESLESGGSKGSFTHKRGVAIQPIDIRGRDGNAFGLEAAGRRSLFQKRRGCSSPLSPKQLDALNKESFDNLSPTFRRCCMDCPGSGPTEFVLYSATGSDQFLNRERKLSRGDNSDSSSKEGSITSDTSMDSEDSCVSVIFVPHPERKFISNANTIASNDGDGDDVVSSATTTAPGTPLALADIVLKKQRSTSNSSSESSGESSVYSGNGGGGSGRGSPMSPASSASQTTLNRAIGSPVKTGNGAKGIAKLELFSQSGTQYEPQTMVTRNLRNDHSTNASYVQVASGGYNAAPTSIVGNGSNEVIFFIERPLEKIDERHTESESELENETEDLIKEEKEKKTQIQEEDKSLTILHNKCNESPEDNKIDKNQTHAKERFLNKNEEICNQSSEKSPDIGDTKLDFITSKTTTIDVYDEPPISQPSPSCHTDSLLIQRRFSEHKSFEMEDIPDENPIKCHPEGLAQFKNKGGGKFVHPHTSSHLPPRHFHHKPHHHHHEHLHYRVRHLDQKQLSRKTRIEYPIVRHHPLFAKQPKSGGQSNFSSLLLGQNVRVIRRSTATANSPSEDSNSRGGEPSQKTSCFEIFNPETDDLSDSDEELDDNFDIENASVQWNAPQIGIPAGLSLNVNKNQDVCQSMSSSSSSSPDSNDSVESVVSARTDDAQRLSAANTRKATGSPLSPNSKSSSASITPVPSASVIAAKTSPSASPVLQHQQLQQQTSTTPSILLITEISDKEEENEDQNTCDQFLEKDSEIENIEKIINESKDEINKTEPKPVRSSSPMKHSQSLDENKQSSVKVEEFLLRSERRRQSLMNLLGENQTVITNIKGKIGGVGGMSSSESSGSFKSSSRDNSPLNETMKRTLDKIQEVNISDHIVAELEETKLPSLTEKDDAIKSLFLISKNEKANTKTIDVNAEGKSAKQNYSNNDASKPIFTTVISATEDTIQATSISSDKTSHNTQSIDSHSNESDNDDLIGKLTGAKPKKITTRTNATQSEPLSTVKETKSQPVTKSILPSIVIPHSPPISTSSPLKRSPLSPIMRLPRPTTRGRLDKARSVSPSSCATPHEIRVFRQSSVPTRFEDALVSQHSELINLKGNNRECKNMKKAQLLQPCIKEEEGQKCHLQSHLEVLSPSISDVSGSGLHSSRESLCGSFDSFDQNRHQISSGKSKSPSPCRSDKSRNSSGTISSTEGEIKKKEMTGSLPKDSNIGQRSKSEIVSLANNTMLKRHPRQQKEMSLSEFIESMPSMATNDDLRATEYLVSTTVPETRSSGSSRSISKESSLDCPLEPTLGLEKLSELDPRYTDSKRRGSSGASTSIMGSCNSDTDNTSQSGSGMAAHLPYRRFDIPAGGHYAAPSRPHRVVAGRDDSVESTTSLGIGSAKSSVQYSDTSSLLSHRFSTISMSSNVSSSDISFGNMTSGSSCYLASMSSADFDDCPIVGGSSHRFLTTSLSEADETDYLSTENPSALQQSQEPTFNTTTPEVISAPKSFPTPFTKTPSIDHSKGSIVQGIPVQGRQGKGHFQEKMRLRSLFQRKQQHQQSQSLKQQIVLPSTDGVNPALPDQVGAKGDPTKTPVSIKERKNTLYPKTKLLLPGKGSKDETIQGLFLTQELGVDGSELTPLPSPLPASLLGEIGAVPPSPGVLTVIERKLPLPRSRIGTTTSQDTSLDQTTLVENRGASDSFEEELFRGLSRDDDNPNNDLMLDDDDEELMEIYGGNFNKRGVRKLVNRGAGSDPGTGGIGILSAASSEESLHSNPGDNADANRGSHGSLTHLRYYHVFKEGELDYLINTYVENLHIISSYHDHSNWCVVAEKVNVWTI